jgi:hypothetical protein
VNEWLASTTPETKAVLRTRLALAPPDADTLPANLDSPTSTAMMLAPAPYGREVFAVVSERYSTGMEVDVLARTILTAIERGLFPGDARGEILYNGTRATIRAIWHSNIDAKSVCAGEVFKSGISIDAADDRSRGIDVDAILWRNLCLNLIIIDENHQSFGSRRHMGASRDLAQWLFDALANASRSVSAFAGLWDKARAMALDSPDVTRDIPADADRRMITAGVFRGLLKTDRLTLPGFRGEAGVDALLGSFDRDPEFCKVGIVNAITRTAHAEPTRGVFGADDIERAAGELLSSARPFQYVEKGEVF